MKEKKEYALVDLGYVVIWVAGKTKYTKQGGVFFSADLLVFGKNNTFWVQVKHKEPREKYPDTGLEKSRYDTLKWLVDASGLMVLILFTDNSKKVYGEWLCNLKEENHGGEFNEQDKTEMIYFWLKDLKNIEELF